METNHDAPIAPTHWSFGQLADIENLIVALTADLQTSPARHFDAHFRRGRSRVLDGAWSPP